MTDEPLDFRPPTGMRQTLAWLTRLVVAALVTAWAEQPAPTRFHRRLRVPVVGDIEVSLAFAADVVMALILWGTTASLLQTTNTAAGTPYSGEFVLLLAALSSAPVLARSRWPLGAWRGAVLGLLMASIPLDRLLGNPVAPGGVAMYLLCLFSVATRAGRAATIGAWVVSVLAICGVQVGLGSGPGPTPTIVIGSTLVAVPLLWGHSVRERREAMAEIADQRRRNEEEQAARAVLEERSRIARELHDVVAHHMSVIAIQAEAAPLRSPQAPEEVHKDLAHIRQTALQALTEMQRVLGILRQDDQPLSRPQPGLNSVKELVDNAVVAGLDVTLALDLAHVDVPSAVGVSLYRIVQESLSNVMRHAAGAAVEVEITFLREPPRVHVRVENGPPPMPARQASHGAGHGLVGMRERTSMLGGELTTEPTPRGGFVVSATLPVDER